MGKKNSPGDDCSVWLSNLTNKIYSGVLSNPHLRSPDQMLWGHMYGFNDSYLIKKSRFLIILTAIIK